MKRVDKRGGKRAGAGRPKKPPVTMPEPQIEQGIDWAVVKMYAEVGGEEQDIVAALGISDLQLRDPATSERLRQIVTQGTALKKLRLQVWIDEKARKGGANTQAQEARNRLGWDKQNETQEPPPDLTSAHARLRLTLERLAKVKSEELGRDVSPAEVLLADALPKKDEPIH